MQQDARFKGFNFGFQIAADGRAEPLPYAVADGSGGKWVWISLDPSGKDTRRWLEQEAKLDTYVVNALLAVETRPRCLISQAGALLILRGVNPDPRSNPTDLVSVRLWIEDDRVITVQYRPLASVNQLREMYEKGHGPKSTAELVVALANGMMARLLELVHGFETEIDKLEDESFTGNLHRLRVRLNNVRHNIVPLRRYLAPQRDAFAVLINARLDWIDDWWRSHLREVADEIGRHIDSLDAIREAAHIVQDALNARVAERTNKVLVILSLGAAGFLPLNLFVGLLGSNVAGIPASQSPYAFWVVVGILVGIMALEYAIYRVLRLERLLR